MPFLLCYIHVYKREGADRPTEVHHAISNHLAQRETARREKHWAVIGGHCGARDHRHYVHGVSWVMP